MVEEHVEGSSIGRTVGNIIVEQYKRTRDGDRFFYKNLVNTGYFSLHERQIIKHTTMGEILRRNLAKGVLVPDNPFLTPPTYLSDLKTNCCRL
jgi:peroxidase